jgi:acyl carrier protein
MNQRAIEGSTELAALRAEVAAVFADALKIEVPTHDADLLATGLLDSLGFVDLLLELERRFGVHLAMEDLEPDDFRSVASIAAFVVAQRKVA